MLKNPNFDETELMNYLQLISEEKKRISNERNKALDKAEKNLGAIKVENDPKLNTLIEQFEKNFKNRIIVNKNLQYKIKFFDRREKNIKALLLYKNKAKK